MSYLDGYETATTGDFANIKSSATGCSWAAGTCNWPAPASGSDSAIDDLWHARSMGAGLL